MSSPNDRTLAAAGLTLIYATIIGFTDNFVKVVAAEGGLWQFHLTRSAMVMGLLALVAVPLGLRLRPRRLGAVLARSLIHGTGMVIYIGALAFLPVALVAAGLFTAPIFVLLISWMVYGIPIGPVRIVAVIVGFVGVLLVLGPQALSGASLAAVLPIISGALYAWGNIATRQWCADESAETLMAGFFLVLGIFGAVGMVVLTFVPISGPDGAAGFVQRGPTAVSAQFYFWTFVQAAGALIGVSLMIRSYQLTDAGRASVLEYVVLPMSALWSWLLWGETIALLAMFGMALIVVAGSMIALRATVH